ncbi:phage replisome organizer N-terminal domain-containing protein [Clostridium sp. ZS6]|uniref:phage replisome organizer N-terminal domain-containing protein n=1 Tax=Clostridium sp. ZS6 TaxID=2949987 RepID=UPI00207A08B7|nr:phage replisome organizer N-terminal domain-containing protein [Clostridium sp. ZS6]
MKERKFVKLRVDMYGDTKFKIIDTMEERDLIHYIWTRLLTLAGKVNLEGKLYMSKSIPYSIETLAIEFNRGVSKIELALNVFKDLEMIELSEDNVYRVKNFAKHQNIKVKEKLEKLDDKEEFTDNKSLINNEREIEREDCDKNFEEHNKANVNNKVEVNSSSKDSISNIKDKERKSKFLNKGNTIFKEKTYDINANINLLSNEENNKKKKAKKPKKKSEDIEELFFEEDIVEPIEWSDEPNLKGKLVKEFNF